MATLASTSRKHVLLFAFGAVGLLNFLICYYYYPLRANYIEDSVGVAGPVSSPWPPSVPSIARQAPSPSRVIRIYQHELACYSNRCWWLQHPNDKCDYRCMFTGMGKNESALAEADVVVYDAIASRPREKQKHQRYIGFYWESPAIHKMLMSQNYMSIYDFEYSYRMKADLVDLSSIVEIVGSFEHIATWDVVPFSVKKKNVMITSWISNCDVTTNGRIPRLEQLISLGVSARNFGRCALKGGSSLSQYHDLAWESRSPNYSALKNKSLAIIGATKIPFENLYEGGVSLFYYAAENSNCEYYHTEKAWVALNSGAIPIYLGSNVTARDYFPENSMIYLADFNSTEDLARHLVSLSHNESAYNKYLEWRKLPLAHHLKSKIDFALKHRNEGQWCYVCESLHRQFNRRGRVSRVQDPKFCN